MSEKKAPQVTFSASEELIQRIEKAARDEALPVASYVRRVVATHLAKEPVPA